MQKISIYSACLLNIRVWRASLRIIPYKQQDI